MTIKAQAMLLVNLSDQQRLLHSILANDIDPTIISNSTDYPEGENNQTVLITTIVTIPIILLAVIVIICCYCPDLTAWIDAYINTDNRAESDRIYGNTVLRQQMEEEEKKKEDPVERRARLIEYFEKNAVQMTVINDSFCQNKKRSDSAITITLSTDNDLSEKDLDPTSFDKDDEEMQNKSLDEEEKELCIPEIIRGADGIERELPNGGRKIQNCCAICLCGYDVGDSITWSINKSCIHAFHNDCILDYLQGQQGTPCPCCRREFTDLLPKDNASNQEANSGGRRLRQNSRAMARRILGGRYSSVDGRQ